MAEVSNMQSGDGKEPSVLIGVGLRRLQDAVTTAMSNARQRALQATVVLSIVLLILWIAAFLYGSFYYSYMPRAVYSTPVHYHYRTDCVSPASFLCSYPVANVSLMTDKKHVLTLGQAYRITLQLEMPDSLANQDLGMFMIKMTCLSEHRGQVTSSARSARQMVSTSSSRFSMLRYRSDLLRTIGTLLFLPAFLTGFVEQTQVLEVELFSDYIDDPYAPSATAIIEILSSRVQIYSSQLYVHAHFTGIRYLLFNFPVLSAVVGVSSNFIFLCILFLLGYVRLLLSTDRRPQRLRTGGGLSKGEENRGKNWTKNEVDAITTRQRTSEINAADSDKQPPSCRSPPHEMSLPLRQEVTSRTNIMTETAEPCYPDPRHCA